MVGSELEASAVRSTACEAGTHAATPQSLGPVAGNLNNIKRLQCEGIKSSAVINIGRKARTTGMGASSASLSISRNQCGRLADPESSLRGHTCRTRSMLIDAASFNQPALTVAATQLVPVPP